jgi:hypothetical protein
MLVYCTMFGLPAFYTLLFGSAADRERPSRIGMSLLLVVFALLIGLRYQVGTDWFNYLRTVNTISYYTLLQAVGYKDPGFGILTWVSAQLGWGIYGPNVVCGSVLMFGIGSLAKRQSDAWLAITAAVPYLVVVIGMGYVRQSAAIGLIMFAIGSFEDRRYGRFLGWMFMAAVFHGPSLVIVPIAAIALAWDRRELAIPLGIVGISLFAVLVGRRASNLYSIYIDAEYSSSGAAIRLFMNVVPAIILLMLRDRFDLDPRSKRMWMGFALATTALMAAFPFFPSSTVLDRLSLYFLPIQMFVFGRLPRAFGVTRQGGRVIAFVTILYYTAALFTWLNFASNAHNWIPYRSVLWTGSPA